jgi:imidazole glycerol phosphate synthase subunit HisF
VVEVLVTYLLEFSCELVTRFTGVYSQDYIMTSFAGQGRGFDIDLVKMVSDAVTIPVIASSGAGTVEHFSEVFEKTNASAALAAGILHRKKVLMLYFIL